MICSICAVRKAKRACPGIHGEICTICCGTEREQSIDCPLDCEYVREAHDHENKREVLRGELPDRDIEVDEEFIRRYEWVLVVLGSSLVDGYLAQPSSTDYDVAEALGALVQTYRVGQSGLIVNDNIVNPYAAGMADSYRKRVDEIRARLEENGEPGYLNEEAVFKLTVFLKRLATLDNNGRKRSRAFLDMLNRSYADKAKPEESSVAVSEFDDFDADDEPRIIL